MARSAGRLHNDMAERNANKNRDEHGDNHQSKMIERRVKISLHDDRVKNDQVVT